MQNRFNNNDFEHFVKQNADQYRMFPSDKVWKGIHNTLHTRRRWYGIGLALLLLTTGVVTWVMLNSSGKNRQVVTTLPKLIVVPPSSIPENKQTAAIVITPSKAAYNKTPFIVPADNLRQDLLIADNNNKENAGATNDISVTEPGSTNTEADAVAAYTELAPVVAKIKEVHQPDAVLKNTNAAAVPARSVLTYNKPVNTPALSAKRPSVNNYSFAAAIPVENKVAPEEKKTEEKISLKNDALPFSIESVINSYKFTSKRKKISFQVYVSPSISYRDLKQNKPYMDYSRNAAGSSSAYYTVDINNVVTHKPDLGLQLGFSAGYPLSKKLKLIGGLQFNVSKYDIKAYNTHSGEVATVTLSTAAGGSRNVSTITNYRNTGGTNANWLHNLYFSVSAPIGLELKLVGNRKAYMGIAGSVQPTYMLRNRSYLISTDYKNYTEIPSLTRKFNINTGFELFAGSSIGKLKWRVGPQIRYQAMSSFDKKYPIQEHLFDFGLKLGIMLNK